MSEAEGGLVNKSIFTVQQHYHKQETTILNDMDSMILNLLSLHNHVGDGKFFTPPWSLVTPLSGTQGGVTCLLPPPSYAPATWLVQTPVQILINHISSIMFISRSLVFFT